MIDSYHVLQLHKEAYLEQLSGASGSAWLIQSLSRC